MIRRPSPGMLKTISVTTAVYVLVNLVVDVLYVFIDPRIRYG